MKIHTELDKIHDAIDVLMKNGCWDFLNDYLLDLRMKAWRTDINLLVGYATVTLPSKSKLPNRKLFVDTCKKLYPDPELWEGLE